MVDQTEMWVGPLAAYGYDGPGWLTEVHPNPTWFTEEPLIEAAAGEFALRILTLDQGTPEDPTDDHTVFEGRCLLDDGDEVVVRDVTWEDGCRDNPVAGSMVRWDHTMMGRRQQEALTFHAACDGMVDVDGKSVPLDLLR